MIELKTSAEIDKMAVTGAFVAHVLDEVSGLSEPGRNALTLEHRARQLIDDRGAQSCYWDYSPSFGRGPFRNVLCISINDAVLHGLPRDYVLNDGDLVTVDFAVSIDGWAADSARTVTVGSSRDEANDALIASTRRALDAGIAAAVPGGHLDDISAAIGTEALWGGYAVNTEFGGHGIGRTMHEDPHISNTSQRGRGIVLRAGMTLAIEPWWSRGSADLVADDDGWTLRSADGSMTAHSEHTIAITDDGARVLTLSR